MMWDDGHMWWGFGPVFVLIFWGLFILLVIVIVRWLAGSSNQPRSDRNDATRAREILEERYARGEIGREEFEQRKRDLEA